MAAITSVYSAAKKDIPKITAFLDQAELVHRHLDWHSVLDWLDIQPFYIYSLDEKIQAMLVAPPDPAQISWIHCFAVLNPALLNSAWEMLFEQVENFFQSQEISLYAIGIEDWFSRLLLNHNFKIKQDIMVLSWNHHLQPALNHPSNLFIRPMLQSDLDEVAKVDQKSFELQWVNSRDVLELAYVQSQHSLIAEVDGRIVGYELSTSNQYSAHLARLAVLPAYRKNSIGQNLVNEMLKYYSRQGIMQLTVNTQSDNPASLHLYQAMGFELTGEKYPVLKFV